MYAAYAIMKTPNTRFKGWESTCASNAMPMAAPTTAYGAMRASSRHSTLRQLLLPYSNDAIVLRAEVNGTTTGSGAISASSGTATMPPPNPAPPRTANPSVTAKANNA